MNHTILSFCSLLFVLSAFNLSLLIPSRQYCIPKEISKSFYIALSTVAGYSSSDRNCHIRTDSIIGLIFHGLCYKVLCISATISPRSSNSSC
uniref:Putative secreted protein n=1 Tax=Xenopsylla cheopis TaxID=163159 RepID=A0A6M2DWC2_XENCH